MGPWATLFDGTVVNGSEMKLTVQAIGSASALDYDDVDGRSKATLTVSFSGNGVAGQDYWDCLVIGQFETHWL